MTNRNEHENDSMGLLSLPRSIVNPRNARFRRPFAIIVRGIRFVRPLALPASHGGRLRYPNDLVLRAPLEGSLCAATYRIRLPGETELYERMQKNALNRRNTLLPLDLVLMSEPRHAIYS